MKKPLKIRRYLLHFSSHSIPQVFTDTLVLGTGVAGMRAALAASQGGSALLVSKKSIQDGSTWEAQGGIAAAVGGEDSPESHLEDTRKAGCGLCDEASARIMTDEGPEVVEELLEWGMDFDRDEDGELAYTQEGGHGRPRILHAGGDATGAELHRTLAEQVRRNDDINLFEDTFAIDLLSAADACRGALAWNETHGLLMIRSKQTVLATGGCGRIFRETTNPDVVTGDGLAMAFRAGVELQDVEFMQFHPTTLYIAGASRALISEALRGEGGVLKNSEGERFMPRYHEQAELAPRDTVSRSILREMQRTDHTHVYLDARDMDPEWVQQRFPTIAGLCAEFDLDLTKDLIPVRPAAHYLLGGVAVDEMGRTNLPNLLACGEVACTGVHGANRLGSNSLLEGLVFGRRAGRAAAQAVGEMNEAVPLHAIQGLPQESAYGRLNVKDVEDSLRSLMSRNMGVERCEGDLSEALDMITFWCRYVMDKEFESPQGWRVQNMLTTARLCTMSARQRQESRGVHYRTDYPDTSPDWARHIVVSNTGDEWL